MRLFGDDMMQLAKEEVHILITDSGITSNQTMKATYEVDFPDDTYTWSSVVLYSTKLQQQGLDPVFFYIANFTTPTFFVNGNWSFSELSNALVAANICPNPFGGAFCTDYISLQDNST